MLDYAQLIKFIKTMEDFVSVYEIAKKFNVKAQTVYLWISNGKIKKEDFKWEEKLVKRLKVRKGIIPEHIKNRDLSSVLDDPAPEKINC